MNPDIVCNNNHRIDKLLETDILIGRGRTARLANVRYQHVIWQYQDEYKKAIVGGKYYIAEKVLHYILHRLKPPSRFVERKNDGYYYVVMSKKKILQRISRSLHSNNAPPQQKYYAALISSPLFNCNNNFGQVAGAADETKVAPTKQVIQFHIYATSLETRREEEKDNKRTNDSQDQNNDTQCLQNMHNGKVHNTTENIQGRQQLQEQKLSPQPRQQEKSSNVYYREPNSTNSNIKKSTSRHPFNCGKKPMLPTLMMVKAQRSDSFDYDQYGIEFETFSSIIDDVLR